MEREYSLTRGDVFHGAILPHQMFSFRPVPGWSSYRTPVRGLYLCGAGAHPGGGVMGAAGHNAAMAVLEDWSELRAAYVKPCEPGPHSNSGIRNTRFRPSPPSNGRARPS